MRPLSDRQLQRLAAALLRQARAIAPEWTERADSDPGVALLELSAWVTENLLYRRGQIPPRGAAVAARLAAAARALAGAALSPAACGVQRVTYFAGQLLNTKDFSDEQDYFRKRLRRLNRLLHGAGIVSGLDVTVASGPGSPGQSLIVSPGFALDPQGDEIEVCDETGMPLPAKGNRLLVQLMFAERPGEPVPVSASAAPNGEPQFSRVEETFALVLAPVAQADAVSIARLTFGGRRWRVDRSFKPPRAHR